MMRARVQGGGGARFARSGRVLPRESRTSSQRTDLTPGSSPGLINFALRALAAQQGSMPTALRYEMSVSDPAVNGWANLCRAFRRVRWNRRREDPERWHGTPKIANIRDLEYRSQGNGQCMDVPAHRCWHNRRPNPEGVDPPLAQDKRSAVLGTRFIV